MTFRMTYTKKEAIDNVETITTKDIDVKRTGVFLKGAFSELGYKNIKVNEKLSYPIYYYNVMFTTNGEDSHFFLDYSNVSISSPILEEIQGFSPVLGAPDAYYHGGFGTTTLNVSGSVTENPLANTTVFSVPELPTEPSMDYTKTSIKLIPITNETRGQVNEKASGGILDCVSYPQEPTELGNTTLAYGNLFGFDTIGENIGTQHNNRNGEFNPSPNFPNQLRGCGLRSVQ